MARSQLVVSRKAPGGGYPVDFCAPLPDEYVCYVCFLAFKDPVQLPCGHQFCRSCWEYCNRSKSRLCMECPIDRQVIPDGEAHTDKALELKVLSLNVKCRNFCDWTGELRFLQEHIKNCPLDFVECTNAGCRTPVRRKNLGKHMSQECQHRLLSCVFCTESYVYKEKEKHLAICTSLHVECVNGCPTKYIKRDQMALHQQYCPMATLPCRYEDVGCLFKGTKQMRDVHEVTSVQDHLSLAMEQLKIQSEKTESAIEKKSAILKLNKDVEFQYGQKRITIKSWRMQEQMIM